MRRGGTKRTAGLLALLFAHLTSASVAHADEPPTVTWTTQPSKGPVAIDDSGETETPKRAEAGELTALELYENVITREKAMAPRSRELIGIVGTAGAAVYGGTGIGIALTADHREASAVGFIGAGVAGLGLLGGAILAPTRGRLEDELAHAKELMPDEDLAVRTLDRRVRELAARERVVRKVTAAVTMAGSVTAIGGGVVAAAQRHEEGNFLLLVGALHGAMAMQDWITPWEIETRYVAGHASAFRMTASVAPLTGGGMFAGVSGQF